MKAEFDLDALAERFQRKGFALAMHLLGNADDAADAVQEGLSVLWSRRKNLRPGQDPAAWFFRVLRNHCIDQLRKRRLRGGGSAEVEDLPAAPADRPDVGAERREFNVRLFHELERLDLPHREILLLRDFQDLSYSQIAAVLGISQGTVMSRLHRARMLLRERLKDFL
ncbi:MAG: RNA polymerase sigma factor [Planctomycetota bacterium]|nr:RNA polymerase sigma factor [Planctomycetota bacterium]